MGAADDAVFFNDGMTIRTLISEKVWGGLIHYEVLLETAKTASWTYLTANDDTPCQLATSIVNAATDSQIVPAYAGYIILSCYQSHHCTFLQ